jgi:hypothetical protein
VFIDVLKKLEYREAKPNFIEYIARSLDKVGYYFSEEDRPVGYSWDASKRWKNESPTLNSHLLRELNSLAVANKLNGLRRLMECTTLRDILR